MATVIYSGIGVTEMFGSNGGTTWQRNANGAFSRNKPIPTQPGGTYVVNQQARFSAVTKAWALLSDAQRLAWIAYAATSAGEYQNRAGITQNFSGEQLFIKLNLAAYDTSFPIEDPPIQPLIIPNPLVQFKVALDGPLLDEMLITFDFLQAEASLDIKVFATAGLSQGIMRPRQSLFRLVSQVNADLGTDLYDFPAAYVARFGVPVEGKKVYCKVIFSSISSGYQLVNGQLSATVIQPA